jgi:hypothetical protein
VVGVGEGYGFEGVLEVVCWEDVFETVGNEGELVVAET